MGASANYFKIGVFTLCGLALIVVMIVALGVGQVLEDHVYMETYFDSSVQGLSKGAPVKFRGVQLGTVDAIDLVGNHYTLDRSDPLERRMLRYVYVKISLTSDEQLSRVNQDELKRRMELLGNEGMRVRLAAQGITGLAYLEADFLENSGPPPDLPPEWKASSKYTYIDSAPSTMAQLADSLVSILGDLKKVPFDEIGRNLEKLLSTLDQTIEGAQVDDLSHEILGILRRIRQVLEKPEVEKLADDAATTMSDIRQLVEELRPDVKKLEKKVSSAVEHIAKLAVDVRKLVGSPEMSAVFHELPGASAQLKNILHRLNRVVSSNEGNINKVLRNLTRLSDSLNRVAQDALKYPSHTLFGELPPRRKETPE